MANTQSTDQRPVPVLSPRPLSAVDAAVRAVVDGFDRVGRVGAPRRMCVEIHGDQDPTRDVNFLGDAPEPDQEKNDTCTMCGEPYDLHWDNDSELHLSGREWHRLDRNPNGYYSDEITAVAR